MLSDLQRGMRSELAIPRTFRLSVYVSCAADEPGNPQQTETTMHRTTADLKKAGREYQAVSRRLRWHLDRHGRAPITVIQCLARARARYMAAVAGRRDRGDAR